MRPKEWAGERFGDLEVISYDGKRGGKHYWRCRCVCGGEAVVSQSNLKSGHTRSCGCRVKPCETRHFVDGTCIESIRSRKISSGNKSGVRGVYRSRRTGRWIAQITFRKKTRYLGSFGTLEEAVEMRRRAKRTFDEFLEKYERNILDKSGSMNYSMETRDEKGCDEEEYAFSLKREGGCSGRNAERLSEGRNAEGSF